jgi:hypothetical protein
MSCTNFVTPLIMRHSITDKRSVLVEEFVVETSLGVVVVEPGFATDYASIPRLFWIVYPRHGRYTYPSVVHDYLYSLQGQITMADGTVIIPDRATADLLFLEMMEATGCRWYTRYIFYTMVRLFGWTKGLLHD